MSFELLSLWRFAFFFPAQGAFVKGGGRWVKRETLLRALSNYCYMREVSRRREYGRDWRYMGLTYFTDAEATMRSSECMLALRKAIEERVAEVLEELERFG